MLRGLVGGIDAQGTFYIESSHPNWIDFKLDAGWIVGIFTFEGDTLKLCVNPFGPPEQLGRADDSPAEAVRLDRASVCLHLSADRRIERWSMIDGR